MLFNVLKTDELLILETFSFPSFDTQPLIFRTKLNCNNKPCGWASNGNEERGKRKILIFMLDKKKPLPLCRRPYDQIIVIFYLNYRGRASVEG